LHFGWECRRLGCAIFVSGGLRSRYIDKLYKLYLVYSTADRALEIKF